MKFSDMPAAKRPRPAFCLFLAFLVSFATPVWFTPVWVTPAAMADEPANEQAGQNAPGSAGAPDPAALLSFPLGVLEISSGKKVFKFTVEIATDSPRQAQGLMWRTALADDKGMIFIFPREAPRSFWMRNTLIPLDMLFLDSRGEIVHIHENAVPKDETPVPSQFPARAVLELRGGLTGELGIQAGDRVRNLVRLDP